MMFSVCVVDVSLGLSVLPRCRCLHLISLYFCPAGSGTVSQVLIDTLTGRPWRVLISLWFDSLAAPLPSLSPQLYNLLADTCCALAFPGGYFQHAGDRTTRMHLQLSLLFQILVSDLWPSFFFPPQWKLRSARQVMCELSVLCQQITEGGSWERLVVFCCWFSLSQITSIRIRSSIHPSNQPAVSLSASWGMKGFSQTNKFRPTSVWHNIYFWFSP